MATMRCHVLLMTVLLTVAATSVIPITDTKEGKSESTCGTSASASISASDAARGDVGLSLLHVGSTSLGRATEEVWQQEQELGQGQEQEQVEQQVPLVQTWEGPLEAGSELRLYAIGSSNLVFEGWYDMFNSQLLDLGYHLPQRSFRLARRQRPIRMPVCDDAEDLQRVRASRLGKPGWGSWGFAYEDNSDCLGQDHGFRIIAGTIVKCMNGWSCMRVVDNPPEVLYRPSELAAEARDAHVVVLSHWINDSKQWMTHYSCYGAVPVDQIDTVPISLNSTLRLIRAIHEVNPMAYILVMARYPEQHGILVKTGTLEAIREVNAAMKDGLKGEPRVVFADFQLPTGEAMFQERDQQAGHPNCRGDKVIATSAVEALVKAGVLAEGPTLAPADECLAQVNCSALAAPCCRRAAMCLWARNGTCVHYGPGEGLVEGR